MWASSSVRGMTTATSLTLRALFTKAAARAGLVELPPITAGLTPPAKALAAVAAARPHGGVTVLVAPTDKDVEQLTSDAMWSCVRPNSSASR